MCPVLFVSDEDVCLWIHFMSGLLDRFPVVIFVRNVCWCKILDYSHTRSWYIRPHDVGCSSDIPYRPCTGVRHTPYVGPGCRSTLNQLVHRLWSSVTRSLPRRMSFPWKPRFLVLRETKNITSEQLLGTETNIPPFRDECHSDRDALTERRSGSEMKGWCVYVCLLPKVHYQSKVYVTILMKFFKSYSKPTFISVVSTEFLFFIVL